MDNKDFKKLASLGTDPLNTELNDSLSIAFSPGQEELINKINIIHNRIAKKKDRGSDFKDTYYEVLVLIKNKFTPLWYEGVSNQLVDVLEYCDRDFFDQFDVPSVVVDKQKNEVFQLKKDKITKIHYFIQDIKHKNRKDFTALFSTSRKSEVPIDLKLTDENYVQIFRQFENELISLFKDFVIKP